MVYTPLVSHIVQSTQKRTNVYIAKEAEANGIKLSSCFNRETVGFHATFLKSHFNVAVNSISEAVTGNFANGGF